MKRSFIVFALLLSSLAACAQQNSRTSEMMLQIQAAQKEAGYTKREVMIPMRDGIRLYTAIYEPAESFGPRPVIMQRTPYGCSPYGEQMSYSLRPGNKYFDNRYIFVFQDVRGQEHSEGIFLEAHPYNLAASHGPANGSVEIDEATDTYDTIEWLVNNTRSNGSVGIKGVSYPGYYASAAVLSNHPALKASSPQAPCTDWFMGDDIHHNGVFMLYDLYNFSSFFLDREANMVNPYRPSTRIQGDNIFDAYLKIGTTKGVLNMLADDQTLRDKYRMYEDIIDHPNYDSFWKNLNPLNHFYDIKPAVMVVGGSYDGEDNWGAVYTWRALKSQTPQTESYFVYGPWMHGSWGSNGFGGHMYGESMASWYSDLEYQFFSYYLEGKGEKPAEVNVVPAFNDNNGKTRAMALSEWPVKGMKETSLYLRENGKASFSAPAMKVSSESYVSDPANPVPYQDFSKPSRGKVYVNADQSFLEGRKDVLSYHGEAVSDTLFLAGPVKADIWVSTDAADLDLVVKLIDVAPDGSQMMIKGDIFRCRYRDGFDKTVFFKKYKATEVKFELTDVIHWVLPGHSLMVQVQSSWYPLGDLNPQSKVENIYLAEPSDYVKANVILHHEKKHPSRIVLPVVE